MKIFVFGACGKLRFLGMLFSSIVIGKRQGGCRDAALAFFV